MEYNPYEQNRKSTRLDNYNYATSGIYFITICTKQGEYLFGDIKDGKIHYTPQGLIADIHIGMLKRLNHNIVDVDYVVMPNHIHLLITYVNDLADEKEFDIYNHDSRSMREIRREDKKGESISSVLRNLKSGITRDCHRLNYDMAWLNRFHDYVVRNNREQELIRCYIRNNPSKWDTQKNMDPLEEKWEEG